MRMLLLASYLCFMACATETHCHAALNLTFSNAAGDAQSSFTLANIGDSTDIKVFFVQTDSDLVLSEDGLLAIGFRLNYSLGGDAIAKVSNAIDVSKPDVSFNTRFDFDTTAGLESTGIPFEAFATSPVFGEMGDSNRILLGTFRIVAVAPGTMQLSFSDLDPSTGAENFLSGIFENLDDVIDFSATANISVSAVPEPSVYLLFGWVTVVIWFRHRLTKSPVAPSTEA